MKRVNLLHYFDIAETLQIARQGCSAETSKGGMLYFAIMRVPERMQAFIADDSGFVASKKAAADLSDTVNKWLGTVLPNGEFDAGAFDKEYGSWQYSEIVKKIDGFKSVFEAECHDADVYSVTQIGIYRTSALVSDGAGLLPAWVRAAIGPAAVEELCSAGKCLAFGLPTACGYHALRSMELVMDQYLVSFDVDTSKLKTWNDYIKAAEALTDGLPLEGKRSPAPKVVAMLDRMRALDRNPLMHPRDTLDEDAADQLFKLAGLTIVEMAKDRSGGLPVPANSLAELSGLAEGAA